MSRLSPSTLKPANVASDARRRVGLAVRGALLRWARGDGALRKPEIDGSKVYFLLMHPYGMGGTIRTVMNLAEHLAGSHDVEIIGVVRTREEPFFDVPEGVRLTPIDDTRKESVMGGPAGRARDLLRRFPSLLVSGADGSHRAVSLWTDVVLARELRKRRSGVMIGTRPGLNLLAAEVAATSLVRIGQEHMNLKAHDKPLKRAIRRGYPGLDALVTLTEGDRGAYAKLLGDRVRTYAIPNAVTRLEGPISPLEGKVVLAAGRLKRQKDFGRLIRAFDIVAASHPDWKLRICGGGPRREGLEKLIAQRGLERNVELAGPVRDLGAEMAKASLYALSSRREGFPMVLLEAMSKGLPVVSFDCPTGPRDIVKDGENGLLVPHQDIEALAAGINAMIEDEDLRRRCGAGAQVTAQRYSIDVIGARWAELLDELGARA